MTWYDTYEEIKAKYPDTIFEEYWLTKDDADKLRNHESVKRDGLQSRRTGIFFQLCQGRMRVMKEEYCYILEHYLHLMMI